MTDYELEQRIRSAVEHAAPDRLEKILSSCGQQNTAVCTPACKEHTDGQTEGVIIDMSEVKKRNSVSGRMKKSLAAIAAAAALFILCLGGLNLIHGNAAPAVDSVVMLDVNPSLSMSVDACEKVLSVEALNSDAEDVLGSMELKDTSLEVAVNAVIGSMLQKGYLGDLQNAILVSVENEDAVRGEALQQKVAEAISNAAHNASLEAAVLSQVISSSDAALAELAAQYNISLGKAALILEVITQAPTLTFEDLAQMTINDIALIAASKNVSSDSVTQSGAASNKAYITQEEAMNVVCSHAGVTTEDVIKMEAEFDSKNGIIIYDVEFETAAKKGEYEINAATGDVLKYELKNIDRPADGAGYISANAAREAALAHAGVTSGDVLSIEIKLDSDDSIAVYEVEFETGSGKYEYKINAVTGEVAAYEAKEQKNAAGQSDGSGTSGGTDAADSSYIGETAAKQAALTHAGVTESSTVYVKCYLEYEGGKPKSYCVEFKVGKTEYEYEIDLYSGTVLNYDAEEHGSSGLYGTAESASYIGESAALSSALAHAGVSESSLTEKHVELDHDGGAMIYEVEFETGGREYEYKIDASSGAVLKSEKH